MTTLATPGAIQKQIRTQKCAESLFDRTHRAAMWSNLWRALRKDTQRLQTLDVDSCQNCSTEVKYEQVELANIVGNEAAGRGQDFDAQFRPLKTHNRERWLSVAKATLEGVTLPPVDLVKVGSDYFVQDGHHRLSVAQALGQATVAACVVILQVA